MSLFMAVKSIFSPPVGLNDSDGFKRKLGPLGIALFNTFSNKMKDFPFYSLNDKNRNAINEV